MNSPPLSDSLLQAYRGQQDQIMVQRLKVACVLSLVIVPMAASMDWVVYPRESGIFLVNRILCDVLVGTILLFLSRNRAAANSRFLAQLWVNIMLAYNAFMVGMSDGVLSPYYAGLNLVVLGACLLLPWTFRQNLAACLASLAWYFLACAINWQAIGPPAEDANWFRTFFNNTFITLSNVAICSTAGYFAEKLRFRDFQLQYELDHNKQALELSYQKLQQLDKARSQFFANISHELRTPLTLILSPLDGLRSHPDAKRDPKVIETLDMMYENGLRLLSLINDLLDLVRLDQRKLDLHLEPIDLRLLLPGIAASVRGVAERCGLALDTRFDGSANLVVMADKDRLEKVFLNLLFNAVKFTPKGGSICVSASQESGSVFVDIKDTGIGIAQENLAAVFDRFWQEDGSETRRRQGTGIGLALVQELVELHGGRVSVTSQKGQGSTFRVTLPKSLESPAIRSAPAAEDAWLADLYRKAQHVPGQAISAQETSPYDQPRQRTRHTLLIVEDEADMQRFLASELGATYNILLASDGHTAWEMAHKHQPKLIVTDMMLPQMDGITLCRQLRASPSLLPTKIVLLTARADDRTKLTALEAGADDFLTKPFSVVELKTRLANLLLTGQLERELQSQNQALESTLQQLRAAEAQLIQNARLSALGNLAAGIMHEINNPVNFMLTATHYLKSALPANAADAQGAAADIQEGLTRIRDIVADLKGFASGGALVGKQECDPGKILRTAKRLLAAEIQGDVQFEEQIEPHVRVLGIENQLIQLLVNILHNALQATEDNPKRGKSRQIKICLRTDGRDATITVWDNGTGIKAQDQPKIFDPFFTTKEVGRGTGLGLSISHTIVQQHDGEISVQSTPGEFAEFTIRLPLQIQHATGATHP